jgi:pimeloyl-ACP methyl ester carboxylesterase
LTNNNILHAACACCCCCIILLHHTAAAAAAGQGFIDYWRLSYDWRKWEAVLNSMSQFSTTIRNIQLHFVWERSDNPDAIPLLLLHGWPGSYFEVCTVGA